MARKEITGVRIKLATSERIREISSGEVKKPETINYRTLRPEKEGLFCERIFGPTRSYECSCGKYKRSGPKFRGIICDRCGVEVTDNRVRRERMGHIELAAPIVHIWYLRGIPGRLSLLLGTSTKELEKVVYFSPTRKKEAAYKVTMEGRRLDAKDKRLDLLVKGRKGDIISESEKRVIEHYDPRFQAEEVYTIETVDEVAVAQGDVISVQQMARYKTEHGEDMFKVEPAFEFTDEVPGLQFKPGDIVSASELERLEDLHGKLPVERVKVNNQDSYVVTAAARLPFAKGDVISLSEYQLFNEKYVKRFTAQRAATMIEDPCYIVIEAGTNPIFNKGDVIFERERDICMAYDSSFRAGIGAEGVRELIDGIDLDFLTASLREEVSGSTGQKKRKLIKRLQIAEDFRKSGPSPRCMVFDVLPVIPPDLRPLVQLDGGRFATSDLNDLYRRVINRNNRLRKLQDLRAPEIIIRNEKRMLQEAVDALIDNGRVGKAVLGGGNRPLKSLTDLLRGKKGRFRQNLLGKRVDYSGRSVIVIGPQLKIYQCGLPKQMALELFKPFVIRQLVERGLAPNVKNAKRVIERGREEIWGILEEIVKDHPVLLNRAPTLHRLGIQAFEPVLMEGKAIRLHPMVCTAFNADFDGDQMAVHVPLSIEAQAEARLLMLSANNLLSPASGKPVVTPTQDIILGIYYLTDMRDGMPGEGMHFSSIQDVLSAFSHETVHVNAKIWLKINEDWKTIPSGRRKYRGKRSFVISEENSVAKPKPGSVVFIETSPGRALFNSVLPEELLYVNEQMDKKNVGKLLDRAYDKVDRSSIVNTLDAIKKLGYHWAARSGISFGVGSIIIPQDKYLITSEARDQDKILKVEYEMGLLTKDEYLYQKGVLWGDAAKSVNDSIVNNMQSENPLHMMVDSGARGSGQQMGQMAGIRGLVSDPSGRIIDYPITSNFREGMDMLEYFISTHGARKGLADTALRTAKSGYLTRRLVDVSQDLIITENDCYTEKGVLVRPLKSDGKVMISLSERIVGRNSLEDVKDSGKLIISKNELIINDSKAKMIEKALEKNGKEELWIRSPLSCELRNGICQKCYGMDLSARREVPIGEAVGVVAAQSIGEPGTQLTMRTFHTGGVRISEEDITKGLPRIEQLFEVRRPKKIAYLAGVDGVISGIRISDGKRKVFITPDGLEDDTEPVMVNIPATQELNDEIREGLHVQKDTRLTDGSDDPQQLLEVKGIEAVQQWLVDQIQEVYRSQGVSINNKHIEVILRKVAPVNRVRVVEEGDTSLVVGDLVWLQDIETEMEEIKQENEASVKEAVEVFSGKKFKGIGRPCDELSQFTGKPVDATIIQELCKPEHQVTHFIVEDNGEDVIVIVGEAAFRKQMEGFELISKFVSENGEDIKEGEKLTPGQLKVMTSCKPQAIFVRDQAMLETFVNSAWLAEDIKDGSGRSIAEADRVVTHKTLEKIRNNDIRSIRKWSNVERIDVLEALKTDLMNGEIWAKPLIKVIDSNGEEVSNISQLVDGSITRGLIDGATMAIEIEIDNENKIITRQSLLFKVMSQKVAGKILLEPIVDNKGNVVVDAGTDVSTAVIETISELAPLEIVVRTLVAKSEEKRFINCFSFIRKLRQNPECRPFIHGVTKAALATESFLSAASFQQTAQILAGAAVKGQIDPLLGLKESVIIGHLIPAGTGAAKFRKGKDSG